MEHKDIDKGEDEETAKAQRAKVRAAEIEADVQSLRLRAKARILRETMGAEAYQKYVVEVNRTIRKAAEQLREAGDRRRQKLRVNSGRSGPARDSSAAHSFALSKSWLEQSGISTRRSSSKLTQINSLNSRGRA